MVAGDTRYLAFQLTARRVLFGAALALGGLLYLSDLTGMGMVSKDEPRYADIGRAMARSGDWITPRLWGQPWFEKPALLYWMIGAGFKFDLGNDLAPRLPMALLSVAFLVFFGVRVRNLWDEQVAWYSTGILATTAGWLAYSHVAVTDLPVSVFFTAAVLYALPPAGLRSRAVAAGALALAMLAKSLVPLVLFLPVAALDYRNLREWFRPVPVLVFTAIALPWYLLCTLRNGLTFLKVLFLQQQFGRFLSPELQHVRPVWYYIPVLLLLLYPWFPLLAIIPRDLRDRRILILLAVVIFGFVFFSLSINKLPGYLLPLIPALCILMGIGLARSTHPERAAALTMLLLGVLPLAARTVPRALADGLHTVPLSPATLVWGLPAAALGALALAQKWGGRAVPLATAAVASALLWFQFAVFPSIDAAASARPEWIAHHPQCAAPADRGLLYGLYYYSERVIPPCAENQTPR